MESNSFMRCIGYFSIGSEEQQWGTVNKIARAK
jgi:hypothetical protein